MNNNVKKLTYSAVALAAAILLPYITANNQELGKALCPMHLPVLLCGFICGPVWGGTVGFIAPLLKHLISGMPDIYTSVTMAFELCGYAVVAGLLYKILPKKIPYTYLTLICSMLCGRVILGIVQPIVYSINGNPYTFSAFIASSFVSPIPAIILQIVLIPLIIIALDKAKLIPNKK